MDVGHYLDPVMLGLLFAGAFAVAMMQNGLAGLGRALAALLPLVAAKPEQDRDAARRAMLKVEQLAEMRGLACTDRARTTQPFLTDAVNKLANSDRPERFETWAGNALADRAERHRRAIAFWNSVADAAPAIGMAGTIIGLIRMFSAMEDADTIGPAMAMALLMTLYGVILANMIAAPIAGRLADLSARELAWQREVADHMLALARREAANMKRQSFREVSAA